MIALVDLIEGKNEDVNYKTHHKEVQGTQPQAGRFSFQTCKVTYGGVDGAYYTSSRTRRTSNDGVSKLFPFSGIADLLLDFLKFLFFFNVVLYVLGGGS